MSKSATDRQLAFLRTLGATVPADITCAQASAEISRLCALRDAARAATASAAPVESAPVLDPGVYEDPSGAIYVVKPNRERTRVYAKRLVEIGGERLAETGEHVAIEFEYAPGAIFRLTPAMRMDFDRAKALTIRYGRCIVCGRKLKDATSVERGIGPVCRESFRGA